MALWMTWDVNRVDPQGAIHLRQKFDRLRLSLRRGTQAPIEYDSAAETAPDGSAGEVAKAIRPILGIPFQVVMNRRGTIEQVAISEEARRTLGQDAAAGLSDLLNPENLSTVFRQAMIVLPEESVAEGDQWMVSFELPLGASLLEQRATYTYLGEATWRGKSLDKIAVSAALHPKRVGPESLKILDQALSGVLWFDSSRGRFVESEVRQTLTTQRAFGQLVIGARVNSTLRMTMTPQSP
jgi:hypothetical protein